MSRLPAGIASVVLIFEDVPPLGPLGREFRRRLRTCTDRLRTGAARPPIEIATGAARSSETGTAPGAMFATANKQMRNSVGVGHSINK